jgi:hypothetical protein
MAEVVAAWRETGSRITVLEDGLRILTSNDRLSRLRRVLDSDHPDDTAIARFAVTYGDTTKRPDAMKGTLEREDAERLLELFTEVQRLVPRRPANTATVFIRAVSVLLSDVPIPPKPKGLWARVAEIVQQFDPDKAASQPQLPASSNQPASSTLAFTSGRQMNLF